MATTVTLYPSQMDTENSQYYGFSSSYPVTAIVGKSATQSGYGVGINLTRNANAETYAYFDFDYSSIPDNVQIDSIECVVGIYASTSYNSRTQTRYITFSEGTTQFGPKEEFSFSSNTTVYPEISYTQGLTREQLSNLKVLVYCKRNSSSTTYNTYEYIRGIDLTITYSNAVQHILTIHANGYTVTPADGVHTVSEGGQVDVKIEEDTLPKVTLDGADISSLFERRQASATTTTTTVKTIGAPTASSYTGLSSGSNYVSYAVGYTAESPRSMSNNWYGSSSATVDSQYAQYTFDVSSIPSDATNIKVSCKIAGKAENSTYSHQSGGRYSVWALCSNGTAKSEQVYTTSTSVTTLEITDSGSWTRSELDNLQLRHYVGYYGGATAGATLTVTYDVGEASEEYAYYYTVAIGTTDHILIIGGDESGPVLYARDGNAWKPVVKVYKKINGAWALQEDVSEIFQGISSGEYIPYKKV